MATCLLFGTPCNMSSNGLIGLNPFQRTEIACQCHLIIQAMQASVAKPANPYPGIQLFTVITLLKVGAPVHLPRNEVMEGEIYRAGAELAAIRAGHLFAEGPTTSGAISALCIVSHFRLGGAADEPTGLMRPQLGVDAASPDQFFVRPHFHDPAAVDNHQPVHCRDS